jgi:hypothetical protein
VGQALTPKGESVKKLRLLLLLLIVASASVSASSAALLCPAPTVYCRYSNFNGCCYVVASLPGWYCPQNCD